MSVLSRNRSEEGVVKSPSAREAGKPVTLSGAPRADLLPPEIGEGNKKKAARRGMRLLMLFVLVLVLIANVGAFYLQFQAGLAQKAAEDESSRLLTQKAGYSDIRNVLRGISEGEAAIKVGGSTDIDWAAYLQQLQALLPSDVVLTDVSIESAGVTSLYEQSLVPLERPRIATLTFTAETSVLPSIPSWIDALGGLPGFADASPQSLENEDGTYMARITMHIDTGAYSHRYSAADSTPDATTAEEVAK